jgi:hypothetical protein
MALEKFKSQWIVFLFIFLLLVSAIIITGYTKPIIYDQATAKYKLDYYPAISYGIVPHLAIGVYNKVIQPSEAAQNIHIKILAMLLFMTAAFVLARSVLQNNRLTALFLLFLVLSRYPFLWLSTELIIAAALFLAIWVMIKGFHPLIVSLTFVLMAFSKPEMALVAVVFLVYYGIRLKKSGTPVRILIIGFFAFSLLLVAPGIIGQGTDYFSGENRSYFSFGQHYAALVAKHQVSKSVPDPWEEYYRYLEADFPGTANMLDVWFKYPLKYFDFVMLSIGHGLVKCVQLFHMLWILLVMIPVFYIRKRIKLLPAEKMILLSLIGCIPFILFAFPHIRYLARYYPLVIILTLMFLKRLLDEKWKEKTVYKYAVFISIGVILTAVIINIFLFVHNLAVIDTVKEFWFPD